MSLNQNEARRLLEILISKVLASIEPWEGMTFETASFATCWQLYYHNLGSHADTFRPVIQLILSEFIKLEHKTAEDYSVCILRSMELLNHFASSTYPERFCELRDIYLRENLGVQVHRIVTKDIQSISGKEECVRKAISMWQLMS